MYDRITIVTGGGRGIGHAIAVALAREGADVFIGDIDAAAGAEAGRQIGDGYQADMQPRHHMICTWRTSS